MVATFRFHVNVALAPIQIKIDGLEDQRIDPLLGLDSRQL